MRDAGGVIPTYLIEPIDRRYLDVFDRAAIMHGIGLKHSVRRIARDLGRSPSTVSREISRNRRDTHAYDARYAQRRAERRLPRPKPMKLAADPVLHAYVQAALTEKWSPQQIAHRLTEDFADDHRMRVSAETIYRSIYVQARGSLKKEVELKLRTGRIMRKTHSRTDDAEARRNNRIPGMINISERPAEVEDRAYPGHFEGDLIVGTANGSQIGTLVERSTRYCMLVHLPDSRDAAVVADAMIRVIRTLPQQLMKSLTWDQGVELAHHAKITAATDVDIYFCDPHSPWQRGSNENTNGLLRQYFPKGTDLSVHNAEHLAFVARELNGRPRKTLGWRTPAEAFEKLLLNTQ